MIIETKRVTDETTSEADKLLLKMFEESTRIFEGQSMQHIAAIAFAPTKYVDEDILERVELDGAAARMAFGLMTAETMAELIHRTEVLKKMVEGYVNLLTEIHKEHKKIMQTVDILCQPGESK